MQDAFEQHYQMVLRTIAEGRVIPLLGAGVNRCGRPDDTEWGHRQYLPDGRELSRYLAKYAAYPDGNVSDLVRVSQYFAIMLGSGPLYEELRELFDVDYPPTPLHRFLAGLPGELRRQDRLAEYQLILTTNYDDALERAFRDAEEPYDLVTYAAVGPHRGKFLHYPLDDDPRPIERPNEYRDISLRERSVILKIHGAVDRRDPERDSYVITEDNYIDYLAHSDLAALLPVTLAAKLQRSHFLFLGYSMRDWNLRVILHRIWGEQRLKWRSWAVQIEPEPIDTEFWRARGVDIFDIRLETYVAALADGLAALPEVGAPA
jgi:hypothetical protein